MQSQIQNQNSKNNKDKRDGYRRSRFRSNDSCSTSDSSMDVNSEEFQVVSSWTEINQFELDWVQFSDKLESPISYTSDSPYLSSLNLPTILEEEAEYEAGNTIKFPVNFFSKQKSEDSPFWIIPNDKTINFEDSCEHSELMNLLWRKIQYQNTN